MPSGPAGARVERHLVGEVDHGSQSHRSPARVLDLDDALQQIDRQEHSLKQEREEAQRVIERHRPESNRIRQEANQRRHEVKRGRDRQRADLQGDFVARGVSRSSIAIQGLREFDEATDRELDAVESWRREAEAELEKKKRAAEMSIKRVDQELAMLPERRELLNRRKG